MASWVDESDWRRASARRDSSSISVSVAREAGAEEWWAAGMAGPSKEADPAGGVGQIGRKFQQGFGRGEHVGGGREAVLRFFLAGAGQERLEFGRSGGNERGKFGERGMQMTVHQIGGVFLDERRLAGEQGKGGGGEGIEIGPAVDVKSTGDLLRGGITGGTDERAGEGEVVIAGDEEVGAGQAEVGKFDERARRNCGRA